MVFLRSYAKQLIEDTIRRNASPVRLDATQGGSCSSLASSASDEAIPRANRNSMNASGGGVASGNNNNNNNNSINNFNVPNQTIYNNNNSVVGGGGGGSGLQLKMPRGGQTLLHSLSTNDASLGEYKYTVGVGQHNVKITGDCFELVRVSTCKINNKPLLKLFPLARSQNWCWKITLVATSFWPRWKWAPYTMAAATTVRR